MAAYHQEPEFLVSAHNIEDFSFKNSKQIQDPWSTIYQFIVLQK